MKETETTFFMYSCCLIYQLMLSLKHLKHSNSRRIGTYRSTYDPQRKWRAFWTCSVCCLHLPTSSPPLSPSAAWHRWPPCCRTWPSGFQWNCSHHTQPQSSSCTHWNAPFGSPEIAYRSVRKEGSMSLGEEIQRGEFS